jgi:predicted AlkP superfamily phosphohydrolase/phosphomutase
MPRLGPSRHAAALLLLIGLIALAAPLAAQPAKAGKLVVLGFDGVDAKLATRWMDEGKLPNLAKLRAEGTFSPLRSTIPSQTPVSWSTFSTGLNPGAQEPGRRGTRERQPQRSYCLRVSSRCRASRLTRLP